MNLDGLSFAHGVARLVDHAVVRGVAAFVCEWVARTQIGHAVR